MTSEEAEYYEASRHKDEAERVARRRRRRILTGILAAAAVVATLLGTVAVIQAERANDGARLARARELSAAAEAAVDTDPALAKLLAVASTDYAAPTLDGISVLRRVFAADRVIDRYKWPQEHQVGRLSTDLHPDGTRLVASGEDWGPSSHLEVYDFDRDEVVWSWDSPHPEIIISRPMFKGDGEKVVIGLHWLEDDAPPSDLGLVVFDGATGEMLDRFELGRCGATAIAMSEQEVLMGVNDCDDQHFRLALVDIESGEQRVISSDTPWWFDDYTITRDGRYVAFSEADETAFVTVVLDVATGQRLLEFNPDDHPGMGVGDYQLLREDGSLLVSGNRPMAVRDVGTGELNAYFYGHAGEANAYAFSPDGELVYSAGREGTLRLWSVATGGEKATFPAVGAGRVSVADEGRILVTDVQGLGANLLDTTLRGEQWGVPTCGGFVVANGLEVGDGYATVNDVCDLDGELVTHVINLEDRQVAYRLDGGHGQHLAVSPDGTTFVRQDIVVRPNGLPEAEGEERWIGSPLVRDLATGDVLGELEGVCAYDLHTPLVAEESRPGCAVFPDTPFILWNNHMTWSPDSTFIAAAREQRQRGVAVWDADSGALAGTIETCASWSLLFTPDGSELLIGCGNEGRIVAVSTDTLEETRSFQFDRSEVGGTGVALVGYSADFSTIVAVGGAFGSGGGALHWLDSTTLQPVHTIGHISDGSPKSFAMSPDRSLVAVGSSDGFVKVWDVEARRLQQEIHVGSTQVQGLAFIDDFHLAVSPETGGMFVYTLDPDELIEIVRGSLSRGFTTAECARFGFGDDCPTLEKLSAANR